MLPIYNDFPSNLRGELEKHNIRQESYSDSGLCNVCIKIGGYNRTCDLCNKEYIFPSEFRVKLTYYPKYPEGETEYSYVCNDCVTNKPQETMDLMLHASDIDDLRAK